MSIKMRQEIERKIVGVVLDELLKLGWRISVNDGIHGNGETVLRRSSNKEEILKAMFSTDEDTIFVVSHDDVVSGWVEFVYGNDGYDVIHNYTTNLVSVLKPANDLADSYI